MLPPQLCQYGFLQGDSRGYSSENANKHLYWLIKRLVCVYGVQINVVMG